MSHGVTHTLRPCVFFNITCSHYLTYTITPKMFDLYARVSIQLNIQYHLELTLKGCSLSGGLGVDGN